jgi:hypothetical protein
MVAKARKDKLKSGDEHDAASRKARRIVPFGRKRLREVKRRMNKRTRRIANAETRIQQ